MFRTLLIVLGPGASFIALMWTVSLFKYQGVCLANAQNTYPCSFFEYLVNANSPFVSWNYLLYIIVALATALWGLSFLLFNFVSLRIQKNKNQ